MKFISRVQNHRGVNSSPGQVNEIFAVRSFNEASLQPKHNKIITTTELKLWEVISILLGGKVFVRREAGRAEFRGGGKKKNNGSLTRGEN